MVPVVFDKEQEENMEGQRENYEVGSGVIVHRFDGVCPSFTHVNFHSSKREYRASVWLYHRRG